MNTRMTLTALALGTVALAGCGSMGKTMSTPAATVTAPVVTAPSVTVTAPSMAAPAMMAPKTGGLIGDPLLQNQGSETMTSETGIIDPSLIKRVEGMKDGDPLMQDRSTGTLDSLYTDVEEVRIRTASQPANADPLLQDQGTQTLDSRESADMAMMADDMSANDAVINACFAAGGQIVAWVGDSTGAEQACRREDGLEYPLSDAQYYQ